MDQLPENITFAIIASDDGWRTDLTIRFCEYFSQKLNGQKFNEKIIIAKTVDEAVDKCLTNYLLILSGGFIPFSLDFFEKLEETAKKNESIFYGFYKLAEDYIILDKRCLFFNLPLWRAYGRPLYDNYKLKQGPPFKLTIKSPKDHHPYEIEAVEGENVFVPGVCGQNGAALVIKQLETFKKLTALNYVVPGDSFHFLSTATALDEIHSETEFEKQFLPTPLSLIYAYDDDVAEHGSSVAQIVVAPAQGLKALSLAEHYRAKRVIVYDNNPLALELQRMIFNVEAPCTYGELVTEFMKRHPSARIADDWKRDQHALITKLDGVSAEFRRVDLFSYQAEEFFKSIDHTASMVVDLSDIYVFPYNYYRRPLYQVQGLFAEVYSILKSRTGPTTVLGLAPGFQRMDTIEINTSNIQFELDPTVSFKQEEVDGEVVDVPINPLFKPETSPQRKEKYLWKAPLKKDEIAEPPARSPVAIAFELGYLNETRSMELGGKQVNATLLQHTETFDDFTAILEYAVDEIGGAWTFKVGTPGDARKIELSNGTSAETFRRHLLSDKKFNPATIAKYFKKK